MGEGSVSQPHWHLSRGGTQFGPLSFSELLRMAELGKLQADDLLWKPGYENWKPASAVPGLLTPPPPTSNNAFTTSSPHAERAEAASGHTAKPSNTALAKGEPKLRFEALRRLWRGEQPLGAAYWLYFVAGTFVASIAGLLMAAAVQYAVEYVWLGEGTLGKGALLLYAPFSVLAPALYQVFAGVGAWRSASWRRVTGILARISIFFALSVTLLLLASSFMPLFKGDILRLLPAS
jgi:hypothetical protein